MAIGGDAGFMMNVQNMETARRLNSDITVMVWEDNACGLIARKQENEFGRHTDLAFGNPDWMQLAHTYGWHRHPVAVGAHAVRESVRYNSIRAQRALLQ